MQNPTLQNNKVEVKKIQKIEEKKETTHKKTRTHNMLSLLSVEMKTKENEKLLDKVVQKNFIEIKKKAAIEDVVNVYYSGWLWMIVM